MSVSSRVCNFEVRCHTGNQNIDVRMGALVKASAMFSRWGFRGWSKSVWASLKADNVFSMTINPAQTDTPMTACALS